MTPFKLSYSDFKEITEFITKKCDHTDLTIRLDPMGRLIINTSNGMSQEITITAYTAENSKFPTLTKVSRLKDG